MGDFTYGGSINTYNHTHSHTPPLGVESGLRVFTPLRDDIVYKEEEQDQTRIRVERTDEKERK